MESIQGPGHHRSRPCALWPVDLKLTHLDWNPDATLIHFQGQYRTICELDYNILQGEIQNAPKTKAAVNIGEFCLVEDLNAARWYRGRVQNRQEDLCDVFLIDYGNVLSVDTANVSSCSNDLFILPPKIVCGFLANVLLVQGCPSSVMEDYFSNQIGRNVTGYIQALLPHKVLLLETPDINLDLVRHGFGRHVDTDTFLLLVEMLTEVPLKQNVEPAPDLLIENRKGQEFCFKSLGFRGYEDILSFYGPRLDCGTRAKVHVTAAVNPGLFYCQMSSTETDLWEMSKTLAAVCEHRIKERNKETSENLSSLCAVKGKDGKWYRGFVQFIPVNSQVRVLFMDYGFFESVKVENVHRLPPDFALTPIMALPCSLRSDQDETVKAQQLSFLKAGLLGKVLDVEIRHFDEEQNLYSIAIIGVEDTHVKDPEPVEESPKIKVESDCDTEKLSSQFGYLYHEIVMREALAKTLEEEEVQVDSVFVGYVEYVQNPNCFWIRTQNRNEDFEEMMTQMADHFRRVKLEDDVLLNPEPGTLCCALHEEDMHFYRAVVTDTLEHGAEVLFIDFGNIEKVPHMLIKKMPKTFTSKSAFAFCCSLVNVVPLEEVWTTAKSDFFRRAVSNKALQVHVLQMRKNKCVVDLREFGSASCQSITELMISSKQAEYWNTIPMKLLVQNDMDVTEKTSCLSCSVTSEVNGNTEKLNDLEEAVINCKNETEMARAPPHFKILSIKPGFEFAVCCPDIKSPSDFWCQPLDKIPALQDLMDKVQQYYSAHTVTLQSGDLCCVAKSPQDGKWYRAFIIDKEQGHAKVMFIDYGHVMQIKDNNLQAIMPEYVHLEGQAFRCSLYNLIEPADSKHRGSWSPEVCNFLKEFVRGSTGGIRCKVVSQLNVNNKGLCNVVDLYNTETQQSITDLLLQRGLVRKVTISTNPLPTVFPEAFVFSSFDLSPGNDEQVYATHVSSQWEVYCQLERNTDVIEELQKRISEESDKIAQDSASVVGRKLCLAKYLDGKWYRGLAHPVQSPLHLSVYFVDYGNTDISEKNHVMFIPGDCGDLLYTPMQAIKCNLASVSKEELYADVKEWLNDAILNKQVRAHIVGKGEDGTFDVELFDAEVNVNEKVKTLIASLSPKPKPLVTFDIRARRKLQSLHPRPKTASIKCKSQHGGRFPNSATSNAHRGSQVVTAPYRKRENTKKQVHGESQRKNTRPKHGDQKKSWVPVKHQKTPTTKQQRECPNKTMKSEQPQHTEETGVPQLSCLPDVKVAKGFRASCFVSHFDSVDSFFLQLSEDEAAILKMSQDLNSGVLRDPFKSTASLRINDLVLAEYEEDGALYRSAVKECEGSARFGVEFVDFGNSAVMGKDKIFALPKEYLSQPRFSIPCSLFDAGIYLNDSSFTDAVMEKPLVVDFVQQRGTRWEVRVEILDGTVGPAAPLEAAVESSTETEKEEKDPILQLPPTMVTTQGATPSPKPKVRKWRALKKLIRHKRHFKTVKFSVKPKSGCTDELRRLTIQAKDTEDCQVLTVLSDSRFYVRLNRTRDLLPALQKRIADHLYKCTVVAEEDVKQGLECFVQLEENKQWHRAVVQSVAQGKCQVLLTDHGLTEVISSRSLRRQCGELRKIQGLAVLCKMNSLGFSEGADESWRETLKPLIGSEVKLLFVCYSEADKLWGVELIMNGLFLVRQITTPPQQNEARVPPPPENPSETAGKSNSDTSQPQKLVFAPLDMDKVYSGSAAAVITPFDFCVVLEDSLLVMTKVSMMLDGLSGQTCPLPEAHLIPGTGCLLKSDTKNKWCRAQIVQRGSAVTLNLVDYGHYESIPLENSLKLKRLPEEMANLPKVIYPCTLRGVKPVGADGQWTEEAAVFFEQRLYQKSLQIFFRERVSSTEWKVDVLADGLHVATELVDAGHASYTDSMLGLRFKEQSNKAAPHSPDSEEECGPDDEGEGKVPHSVGVFGSSQCFLM